MTIHLIARSFGLFLLFSILALPSRTEAQIEIRLYPLQVDTNGSCMGWHIKDQVGISRACTPCQPSPPGESDVCVTYGSCDEIALQKGVYSLHLGAETHQFEIVSGSSIRTIGNTPSGFKVETRPGGQGLKINFENEVINIDRDGFPGNHLWVQPFDPAEKSDQCMPTEEWLSHPKIMRGSRFLVTGEWSDTRTPIKTGGTAFQMDDMGNLSHRTPRPDNGHAFILDHASKRTIRPNSYYWLRHALPNPREDIVLTTRSETCPVGYTLWTEASGKFMLGATESGRYRSIDASRYDADLGDHGGASDVTLTTDQMPRHKHGSAVEGVYSVLTNGNGQQGMKHDTASPPNNYVYQRTPLEEAGAGEAHDNMPPYIAVNFCVPAGE